MAFLLIFVFFGGVPVQAEVSEAPVFDFGIKEPGLLPVSPFYFLKEWRRDIVRSFAEDTFLRMNLELQIFSEKAVEFQRVESLRPDNEALIKKTFVNYVSSGNILSELIFGADLAGVDDLSTFLISDFPARISLHESFILNVLGRYNFNQAETKVIEFFLKDLQESRLKISEYLSPDESIEINEVSEETEIKTESGNDPLPNGEGVEEVEETVSE